MVKKTQKEEVKVEEVKTETGLDPEILAIISALGKKYDDKNLVMPLGKKGGYVKDANLISTGSLCVDRAIGVISKNDKGEIVTGIPRGRIVEIFGEPGSGKSTLISHMMKSCQNAGSIAGVIDVEQVYDKFYAEKIGVDTDKLFFCQPSYAEQALDVLDSLVRSGKFGILCLDSVAALVTQKELEGQMGDAQMGGIARLMSQAMRKINGFVNKTGTIAVFTNQIRKNLVGYGNPNTTTGGEALKFFSSIRMELARCGYLKDGAGDTIGIRVRMKTVKNKISAPCSVCEFDILFGHGIDTYGEVVDIACDYGIIDKNGSWFAYKDMKLGQGRQNTSELFKKEDKLFQEIKSAVLERMYLESIGEKPIIEEPESETSELPTT